VAGSEREKDATDPPPRQAVWGGRKLPAQLLAPTHLQRLSPTPAGPMAAALSYPASGNRDLNSSERSPPSPARSGQLPATPPKTSAAIRLVECTALVQQPPYAQGMMFRPPVASPPQDLDATICVESASHHPTNWPERMPSRHRYTPPEIHDRDQT